MNKLVDKEEQCHECLRCLCLCVVGLLLLHQGALHVYFLNELGDNLSNVIISNWFATVALLR